MERALVVGVSLVLVLAVVSTPGVVANEHAQSEFDDGSDFDAATFYVEVFENGSVEWTSQYQVVLENESERREFEAFAEQFEREETDLSASFERQVRADMVAEASNVTGRSMDAISFSRAAAVETENEDGEDDTLGIVELSFVWTNATVRENGRIVLGDVFDDGLYLAADQSLVIHAGSGLQFTSVSPMEDAVLSNSTLNRSESVTWSGEQQFSDRRPRAELEPEEDGSTGEPAGLSWMVMVALLVALLGVGAALLWRQVDWSRAPATGEAKTSGTSESTISDEELLSDEARVVRLLSEHGGRMKQVDIVEDTGWSKAKVSTLLSDMAEEGKISKLRIGRENIITLEREESLVDGSTDEGRS